MCLLAGLFCTNVEGCGLSTKLSKLHQPHVIYIMVYAASSLTWTLHVTVKLLLCCSTSIGPTV